MNSNINETKYAKIQQRPSTSNKVKTIVVIQIEAATFALAVIYIGLTIKVFSYEQYFETLRGNCSPQVVIFAESFIYLNYSG